MKKEQFRLSIEPSDLEKLKTKSDILGISVATYCRIILKKNANEFK